MKTQNTNTEKTFNGVITAVELIATSPFKHRTYKVSFATGAVYVQLVKGENLDESCSLGKRFYFKGQFVHTSFLITSVEKAPAVIVAAIVAKVAEIAPEDVIYTGKIESFRLEVASNGNLFGRVQWDSYHPQGLIFQVEKLDMEMEAGDGATYYYKMRRRGTVTDYTILERVPSELEKLNKLYAEFEAYHDDYAYMTAMASMVY